jgi:hypothetical protein
MFTKRLGLAENGSMLFLAPENKHPFFFLKQGKSFAFH